MPFDPPGTGGKDVERVMPLTCSALHVIRGGRAILSDLSFNLEGRGLTALLGPNGAGKSMLLRVMASLVAPDSGQVTWNGRAPDRSRRPRLGFVFQKPILLRRSAAANIDYVLAALSLPRAERKRRTAEALERAGLQHLAGSPARVLSGGEQQRLALARALAAAPEVLLLDEPTSNLDPASTLAIEQIVSLARDQGTRILLVTHDIGQARRLADEVAFLHHGRLLERGPAESFFENPKTPAAQAFLSGSIVL